MDEGDAGGAANASGNRAGDDADLYGNDGALEMEGDMGVAAPPTMEAGSPWEQTLKRCVAIFAFIHRQ